VLTAQLANAKPVRKPVEMWWPALYNLGAKNKEAGMSRLLNKRMKDSVDLGHHMHGDFHHHVRVWCH
jgi:hypothetical protein